MRLAKPVLTVVHLALGASAGQAEPACPTAGDETAQVVAVEPRLELRLADGRLVRLAGLDPPMPTPGAPDLDETTRSQLATRLAGKPVTLVLLSRGADRWGRWPALVFETGATGGTTKDTGGLAAAAIKTGLGRYLAEPAARRCRDALLAAEQEARAAKLGLWADPYYGVLAVDDRVAFIEHSGTNVLAEARLQAVEPSPYRTTLRFESPRGLEAPGSHGGHMLVATILPRLMKTFQAGQMDFNALIGRRLRFRGLLDMRFGPRIELAGPDDVEIVDAPPTPPN